MRDSQTSESRTSEGPDTTRGDGFERRLCVLAFLVVCVSLVSALPQAYEFFVQGHVATEARVDDREFLLLRLLRELSVGLFVLYLGYGILHLKRVRITRRALRVFVVVALVAAASATYSVLIKELPAIVPLIGLRIFQYTPLALAGFVIARRWRRESLIRFADLLRWFVAINLLIGFAQVLRAEGRVTLFGGRPMGTAAGINAFAVTLVACALWFLVARISHHRLSGSHKYTFWLIACAALAFLTTSRTAMVLAALVLGAAVLLDRRPRTRMVALLLSPILMVGMFLAVSNQTFTGRATELSNYYRQQIVTDSLACFETPADLVLGCGLGLFSTSINVLFGEGAFAGQVGNVHSAYVEIVAGFGITGLLLYLSAFVVSARIGPMPETGVFLLVLGLLGLPFSIWGMFPGNALLLLLWGYLLGIGAAGDRGPTTPLVPDGRPLGVRA